MIELQALTFRYSGADRDALHDITLTIPDGSFLGVIGPAGAGKETGFSAAAAASGEETIICGIAGETVPHSSIMQSSPCRRGLAAPYIAAWYFSRVLMMRPRI